MSLRFTSKLPAFAVNLAAYGASEAASKASRLLVVVVVARTMDPAAIGLAAGAMAMSDILKSLTENGVVQRIIACAEADLEGVCKTAHRLFWRWCLGLFALQIMAALAVWSVGGSPLLAVLVAVLAIEYVFMPGGIVNCALAMREGKLKSTAMICGGQLVIANGLTVVLAVFWPDPLAIVLPKVLSAPIWLIAMRRLRPWHPERNVTPAQLRPFARLGAPILGVEIVKALRFQADKLIIGALLGAEALGLYFFAFNAGLGLATSFSQAFSIVLFPHLCAAKNREAALGQALKLVLVVFVPVVLIQALLAPIYVPILFGDGWAGAEDLVAILCLAAIPGIVWSAAAQRLRAADQAGTEFLVTAGLAVGLITATIIAAPYGLLAVAWSYLAVASLIQITAAWPAIRTLFPRTLQEA